MDTRLPAAAVLALFAAAGTHSAGTWRQIPLPPESAPIRGLAAHGDTLWAAQEDGIWSTVDGGRTWTGPGTGLPPGGAIGLARWGNRLVACQDRILSLSEDGGRTWSARDTLVTLLNTGLTSRGDTLFALFTLFAGNHPDGSRISTDGGLTWSAPAYGLFPGDSRRTLLGKTYVHGFSGTLLYLDSGAAPVPLLPVPEGIQEIEAAGGALYLLKRSGVCLAAPGGDAPWRFIGVAERAAEVSAVAADSARIAVQTVRGISHSDDGGLTWEYMGSGPIAPDGRRLTMGGGRLFAWASGASLIHRYDFGAKAWGAMEAPVALGNASVAVTGNLIAYGGAAGSPGMARFFLSRDGGASFEEPRTGAMIAFPDAPFLLAWAGSRLFRGNLFLWAYSQDSGRTWIQDPSYCGGGSESTALAGEDSMVYSLSNYGLYARNGRGPCQQMSLPAETKERRCLAAANGRLYLGSDGGLWVWEKEGVVSLNRRANPASRRKPPSLPVRAWAAPGVGAAGEGAWFDATGAFRVR